MGDRGNIVVDFGKDQKVYLYTHWTGTEIGQILQDALNSHEGQNRADDPSYLTRILFDHLTKGASNKETGFGVSPYETDNNHPLLVVSPEHQTVRIGEEDTVTFAEFRKTGAERYAKANKYSDDD